MGDKSVKKETSTVLLFHWEKRMQTDRLSLVCEQKICLRSVVTAESDRTHIHVRVTHLKPRNRRGDG